jgi:F0F1-type ATP synthase assembly protein I
MIRLLLRIYPAAWRAEYGDEFAALLRSKPLTASVIANVILSGFRERLRQSDPAIFCGIAFTLLFLCLGLFNIFRGSTSGLFLWSGDLLLILVLAGTVAAWSAYRRKGVLQSCLAALKAGYVLSILCGQIFFSDASRFFCGAGGIPGCGLTTLFFRSSLRPPLSAQLLVFTVPLVSAYLIGALLGWTLGRLRRPQVA